jgi:hypothetical protein
LLAYVHAMYGAILAGYAIIKRMAKRSFSLITNEGVTMFEIELDNSSVFDTVKAVRNNALVATVKDTSVFATATQECIRYMGLVLSVPLLIVILAVYLARSDTMP